MIFNKESRSSSPTPPQIDSLRNNFPWQNIRAEDWLSIASSKKWVEPSLVDYGPSLESFESYDRANVWPLTRRESKEAWGDLRARLFEERGRCCEYCGKGLLPSFRLHHTTYDYGDNPHYLRLVDSSCHSILSSLGEDLGKKRIDETIEGKAGNRQYSGNFLLHIRNVGRVRNSFQGFLGGNFNVPIWWDNQVLTDVSIKDWGIAVGGYGRVYDSEWKIALMADVYSRVRVNILGNWHTSHFFINVDPLSEVNGISRWVATWRRTVLAYQAYLQSGKFKHRFQANSFRVLVITKDLVDNYRLKRLTEEEGGDDMFWFTTIDELVAISSLTNPIWNIPGKYGAFPLLMQ